MKINGKPTNVSKEYVRSWVSASACVLAHHGYIVDLDTLLVRLLDSVVSDGGAAAGASYLHHNTIEVNKHLDAASMSTVVLHEIIHRATAPDGFGEGTDEKCTSTLNARLHDDVAKIAKVLIDGTYKRAAYFAHTKISYRTDEDHYDSAEWNGAGCGDKYARKEGDACQ